MPDHVVVIGAGAVGAATALTLAREGHRVTILEPGEPGGPQAASYGNACWISPESVVPMGVPGIWRKVPGFLADPLGPLTIRWRHLPRLAPWLAVFLRANATVAKLERTSRALAALLVDAVARHEALAAEAGAASLIARAGHLYAWRDRAAFDADALGWRLRREAGIRWIELSAEELHQREPALSRDYTFALLIEDAAHVRDPGALVAAYVAAAAARGATLVRGRATGFVVERGRLRAVRSDAGEIAADRAVIATGAHGKPLAAALGDRVPLESERGYHVVIRDPEVTVRTPVMIGDARTPLTPTAQGLRVAGQVELASLEAEPDWRRAEVLKQLALRLLPGLPRDLPAERLSLWMGHRPSIADGLPVIGPASGCADVIHAFGHGHVGLASAPKTAALVADLLAGRAPVIDPAPYSAARFR
ncbi:FAD-dependent oxidoreductase [Elioraea sp. Yellowstone]|jgi:D-amino-acid dehydrogenase|uniref:NAD(P)/FAD-dependent oxidoreductase n=1 Tax=Elioraea sp. Yellowstone TaxID=2592070 RepID=UPI00114F1A23|nr:FAD-dependent oxidoreductase [Elioraea sp. Yellowstone]TQF84178.1 FAD-dependent oxidoreductase [Elioraea sp. Yellowstone]